MLPGEPSPPRRQFLVDGWARAWDPSTRRLQLSDRDGFLLSDVASAIPAPGASHSPSPFAEPLARLPAAAPMSSTVRAGLRKPNNSATERGGIRRDRDRDPLDPRPPKCPFVRRVDGWDATAHEGIIHVPAVDLGRRARYIGTR